MKPAATSTRPFILDPLFKALSVLPGIGDKTTALVEKLVSGPKVLDLLWHLPVDFIDRTHRPDLTAVQNGDVVTVKVIIDKHTPPSRRGLPYKIWCRNASGSLNIVYFHPRAQWLERQFPVGEERLISGQAELYNGVPQIVHPDYILKPDELEKLPLYEPIYPLTAGVTNKTLQKAVNGALGFLMPNGESNIPEWLDAALLKREGWQSFCRSLNTLHAPQSSSDIKDAEKLRARVAYDELLANQLALALVRFNQRKRKGRAFEISSELREKFLSALPFSLTNAQNTALSEIDKDMQSPSRMVRLLQGDVGSGKTVVAALAMLSAIGSGAQAALMAPTEILARQHASTLQPWFDALNIKTLVLSGRDKGANRTEKLSQIENGEAQIIIGTHAIFQDSVVYKNLGLVVIDEQHRFGVNQRMQLSNKGGGVDILAMTATPIPRSLALTAYGDMEVSRIDEKPPGRMPVQTLLVSNDKIDEMIAGLKRRIQSGARVYWVCPLVEDSEVLDLQAAEARYDILKDVFGQRVALVHGRMKADEKDAAMLSFKNGDTDILVATTVIEVGVDVPEATIMVIEHAERFGLSQLHQLRGRVGRGSEQSYCFLVYAPPLGETAKERLSIMRESEDGFVIAEKDLELRGGGDVMGVRQSGMPTFKVASLPRHNNLLLMAAQEACLILEKDPELTSLRGQALRALLYLFEQDQGIRYLRAG